MDRTRLQSAAAEYPYLRGLTALPGGALFIVAALGNWAWGPFASPWVFVASLLVLAATFVAVNRFYTQHFGRVTPSTRQQVSGAVVTAAGVVLMVGATTLLRGSPDWSLDLPVNPLPATFAVLMLAFYAAVVGLRPHHLAIFGSLFVAGALPVWDGSDPANVGLVMCGVAVAVNGVFDHLRLVRTLGPARVPAPDGTGG